LLTFGKNQVTELGVLDLGQVIFEFHSILANALGKDIDFRVHVEKPLWQVLAHRMHVELLLTNLCFNARDSFLGAGRIELIIKNVHMYSEMSDEQEWRIGLPRGDYVEILVSDTGKGISKSDQQKLFEPFFTTKGDTDGSGLGLMTVYNVIKNLGGDIAVKSEEGVGSTFRVLIPKCVGEIDVVEEQYGHQKELEGTETILLVDENNDLRTIVGKILRQYGYAVIEAKTGLDFFAHPLESVKNIDLLITDIIMPKMSGLELVQRLKQCDKNASFETLFTSANTNQRLADYGVDKNGFHFLTKPYSLEDLLKMLRSIFDR
jgi:two-component system cell cycle sensor histidine kinase/response regulator CckA